MKSSLGRTCLEFYELQEAGCLYLSLDLESFSPIIPLNFLYLSVLSSHSGTLIMHYFLFNDILLIHVGFL